jgi:hypothetical protein
MTTTENKTDRQGQIISKGETRNYLTAEVVYKGKGYSRIEHQRYDKITGKLIPRTRI